MAADPPALGTAKQLDLGDDISLEVVYIPPSEFKMGSTPAERAWATGIEGGATPGTERESYEGEQPRLMRVHDGYWIGRTEVSVGQFQRFVAESGYVTDAEKPGGWTQVFDPEWKITAKAPPHPWISMEGKSWRDPNFGFPLRKCYPVVCVSWNDGRAFGEWLTKRERDAGRLPEGLVYRLPTEAEWEYAARAGTRTRFPAGDDPATLHQSANIFDRETALRWPRWRAQAGSGSDGHAFTAPVGSFAPNAFGLYDMVGNVWEWCADWYGEDYYAHSPVDDPQGPASGEVRVRRGGSWHSWPLYSRVAFRNWNTPETRYVLVGFRLLREAAPATTPR